MKRRDFIKHCSLSATGIGAASALVACKPATTKPNLQTPNAQNQLQVDRSLVDSQGSHLVSYPNGKAPIAITLLSPEKYSACLMDCTHQHCQTAIVDSGFVCPCHGARYDKSGRVTKGPADKDLKSFEVVITDNALLIQL